jgi:DeoR family ulaG and ulaABCDEF operon transcriptional repressor
VVCALAEIDTLITDDEITDRAAQMIEREGIKLIVAKPEAE